MHYNDLEKSKQIARQFLEEWKAWNYGKMNFLASRSWQIRHGQDDVKRLFESFELHKYEFRKKPDTESPTLHRYRVRLLLSMLNGRKFNREFVISVHKESAPFREALHGVWGVQPLSVLGIKKHAT